MESLTNIKTGLFAILGFFGSLVANMLGGWDAALQTLLVLIAVDYILGIILAGVFHKSSKTETGRLQSVAGWKGLCKKSITLMFILIACQVDKMLGADYVRYGMIIAFSINELVSITETADTMGFWVPPILIGAIEVLKKNESERVRE